MALDMDESAARGGPEGVWPWVPFGTVCSFATLPYVELWGANVGEVSRPRMLLWWLGTLTMALGVLVAGRGTNARARTAVFVALLLYLGFRFPVVERALDSVGLGSRSPLLGWSILALSCAVVIVPLSRRPAVQIFVAMAGAGLLVVAIATLVVRVPAAPTWEVPSASSSFERQLPLTTPNIWVLVPDGYSRADVIERRTGRSIEDWTDALERRGFRVATEARSNYTATWSSIPSLLEMAYVIDEATVVDDRGWLHEKIVGANASVRTLRTWGYGYMHAYSGAAIWEGSQCVGHEDRCIGESTLTETDWGVLRSTPLIELFRPSVFHEVAELADPRRVVDEVLSDPPDEPFFVLAHLMSPHPPFVRDDECRFRPDVTVKYVAAAPQEYRDMVECLNHQLLVAVDKIRRSDPEAVIVIQSDHGHDWGLDWDDPRAEVWGTRVGDDRWPVLSALRLPPGCAVPPDLSNVDVMRLTFSCLTGERFQQTPYRSWITAHTPEVVAQ